MTLLGSAGLRLMCHRVALLLIAGPGLVSPSIVRADAVHATFIEGKHSLANRIRFPRVEGDVVVLISCAGSLRASGRFDGLFCYEPRESDLYKFHRAVSKATRTRRRLVTPLTVDGKAVGTWFRFTVSFTRLGATERIRTWPNHGLHANERGFNYKGAQRFSEEIDSTIHCPYTIQLSVEGEIDAAGVPTSVRVVDDDVAVKCAKGIERAFMGSRFVPAMQDGQPFSSKYRELYFTSDRVRGKRRVSPVIPLLL